VKAGPTPEATLGQSWATFYLDDEMLAIAVHEVHEVLMDHPVTPVPLAPPDVVGLLNLRGQVMPAVDLRRRLHFPPRATAGRRSFIVLKPAPDSISLVVDAIGDVLELPPDRWRPPPETLGAKYRDFVFGICPIEGHVVVGLRAEALHAYEELAAKGG
jgi:purine-binding chemotaxis protein CheW